MKRTWIVIASAVALVTPTRASDWEKFYTPISTFGELIDANSDPEQISSQGSIDSDIDAMWRRGFAPIGFTYFNASNTKTKDGLKLAKKLKARYIVVGTQYTGSNTGSIPITTPTTSTTTTQGTASAYGSGGSVQGTYSGTSTTYGSQTTYMPFSVNRYDKFGIYFKEMPKRGIGVMYRELTSEEISKLETRRAIVVMSIRDASPAYQADILPGDIVISVNGQPADIPNWKHALRTATAVELMLVRNGSERRIEVPIPPEWR